MIYERYSLGTSDRLVLVQTIRKRPPLFFVCVWVETATTRGEKKPRRMDRPREEYEWVLSPKFSLSENKIEPWLLPRLTSPRWFFVQVRLSISELQMMIEQSNSAVIWFAWFLNVTEDCWWRELCFYHDVLFAGAAHVCRHVCFRSRIS